MLTPSAPLLQAARAGGYAVGAFNVSNLESMQAIVRAAEAERAPVLAMIWSGIAAWTDFEALAAATVVLAEKAAVPIAVHLDHGEDLPMVRRSLAAGFTSVMYDGARHPIAENIRLTNEAKALAQAHGASLEAELGEIGGEWDEGGGPQALTDPAEAARFAEATGVDCLAIAIGSRHGRYTEPPRLDLARLRDIAGRVSSPLSLHGGSYTPDDQVRAAISLGIAKVNIATELEHAFLDAATTVPRETARFAADVIGPGYQAVEERIRAKIRLFGSSGRA